MLRNHLSLVLSVAAFMSYSQTNWTLNASGISNQTEIMDFTSNMNFQPIAVGQTAGAPAFFEFDAQTQAWSASTSMALPPGRAYSSIAITPLGILMGVDQVVNNVGIKRTFLSTDNGVTWNPLEAGLDADFYAFHYTMDINGNVYAAGVNVAGGTSSSVGEMYVFNTSTNEWDVISTSGINPNKGFWNIQGTPGGLFMTVRYVDNSFGVLYSTDGGSTWTSADAGLAANTLVRSFTLDTYGTVYAAVTGYWPLNNGGNGIYKFDSGTQTWSQVNTSGLSAASAYVSIEYTTEGFMLATDSAYNYTTGQVYNSQSGLSVSELEENPVNLYPNPVRERLNFDLSHSSSAVQSVRLISLSGRLVRSVDFSETDEVSIDTDSLRDGIYLCDIELSDGTHIRRRFIKVSE